MLFAVCSSLCLYIRVFVCVCVCVLVCPRREQSVAELQLKGSTVCSSRRTISAVGTKRLKAQCDLRTQNPRGHAHAHTRACTHSHRRPQEGLSNGSLDSHSSVFFLLALLRSLITAKLTTASTRELQPSQTACDIPPCCLCAVARAVELITEGGDVDERGRLTGGGGGVWSPSVGPGGNSNLSRKLHLWEE